MPPPGDVGETEARLGLSLESASLPAFPLRGPLGHPWGLADAAFFSSQGLCSRWSCTR